MAEFPSLASDEKQPVPESSTGKPASALDLSGLSNTNWSPLEVPLWIENPSDANSEVQPLTFGIPLPRGRVFSPCYATLIVAGSERTTDTQSTPLAHWSDGSIRWLLIDALLSAVTPGKSHAKIRLTSKPSLDQGSSSDLSFSSGGFAFEAVGNGSTPVRLSSREENEKFSVSFQLTDSRGQTHTAMFHGVETETTGPIRTTIKLQGTLPTAIGLECRIRLSLYAHNSVARMQVTLHNPRRAHHEGGLWDLGDPGSVQFQSWVMKLSGSTVKENETLVAWQGEPNDESPKIGQDVFIYQDSSGGENWRSPVHMNRSGRVPCQFRGYRVKSGPATTTGLRANPTVALRQNRCTVAVSVPEFWQQFPMSLQANSTGIEVGLFSSKWSDQFELQGGEQKTHTVWMQLSSDLAADSQSLERGVQRLSRLVHSPIRIGCSPEWYSAAQAMDHLLPSDAEGEHPTCRDILQHALVGEQSLFAKRETIDEYGWRNFGDVWADHEQAYFKGSGRVVSHYNNQFDQLAGGLRQFMQSGDSAWWSFAAPLAQHVIDIDLYRTTQDRAAYNGGLFWFTDHYYSAATSTHRTYSRQNAPLLEGSKERSDYGGGPGSEHNFATGLLYYYWMTGEPAAAEAVGMLADWVIAMDDGRQNFLGLLDDGPTGLASMSTSLEFQGPGRGAANSMQTLLDAWLLTREARYMAKCETILKRVIHPVDDIASLNLLDAEHRWSYTMFLSAIVRYLEIKAEMGVQDESYAYARESLLAYARWMTEHERPYLDHPEQLQFPTEAWAAQDLRKANVLRLAASFESDPVEAAKMRQRGEELAERCWSDLQAFPTRQTARAVAIVMTEGALDGYLRSNRESSMPKTSSTNYNFGMPVAFVPQKLRIRNQSRKPLGILQLLLAALRPTAWLRLLLIYNRHRVRKLR